jgi:WD40 repeat protein/DNA-binding SARP family transcriptional activator
MTEVDSRGVGIQVLGPLTIDGDEGHGSRDRVVLEALVVRAGAVVDKQELADALWGEALPVSWPKMVQGCIVRLRKRLPPGTIETTPYGYRLVVHEDQLDARRFEHLLGRAREHLADRDPDRASYVLAEALSLWRGRPLPDLDDWEPGRAEAVRLDGLRLEAEELRLEAEIAAGRARTVSDAAQTLVSAAPFRERRWALFARALYQSGRQTEALDVLGRARHMLREELGLDPGRELVQLEESILNQDPELAGREELEVSRVCPYRGLLRYDVRDAESFFGREAAVAACLETLRTTGVLAVVGPSGTGKSSLVRAGVVASLERDGTPVLVTNPGARPLDSLAQLPARGPLPVLVVDQAEEAVTLCSDLAERSAYFTRLDEYAAPLVFALRADRLGDLSVNPQFARMLERGLYLPGAMSEENLRAAIEGPARHAGLRLEAGLVDLLVREVEGEPGALPLLSHVLRQTWEVREGPTLTVEGYRRTGGIRNAVAQSAEHLYGRLDDRQRAHLRALFLRLVVPSDDGGPVRTRVARANLALDVEHEQLVEDLVDARLLSSDEGDLQLAHEALAREWPRLRDWLDEDVDGQRIFRHLSGAAQAWESMHRPESELYRGVRLAGAVDWAGRSNVDLTKTEQAFLDASSAQAEQELRAQARSNRRLRLSLVSTAALLVAALVAGVLAIDAARRSDRQAEAAADAARLADSRRLSAQALVATEPDLSLLLAVEGVRRDDSLAARSTVYSLLARNSQLRGVARGRGDLTEVELGADGRTVTTSGPDGIAAYDAGSLNETSFTERGPFSALAESPDGRLLVAAAGEPEATSPDPRPLRVLSAGSFESKADLGGVTPRTSVDHALDFSADGRRVAAGLMSVDNGSVAGAQVWDLARPGLPVSTIAVDGVRIRVALSPRGDVLYVASRGPSVLRAYDVRSGRLVASTPVKYLSERIPPLVLSPDGSLLATSHRDGVALFDAKTLAQRLVLPGQLDDASALAFSGDGGQLAVGFVSGSTAVWDLTTRKLVRTVGGHSQPVEDVVFAPGGGSLYTVARDRRILAWDVTGARGFPPSRRYASTPTDAVYSVPSPDGRMVAYFTYRGQFQFRDVATGRLTRARKAAFQFPCWFGFEWSPDSREFTTAGGLRTGMGGRSSHTLQVWDPHSGRAIYSKRDAEADEVMYTSDGRRMIVASVAGTMAVLDRQTLRPLRKPIKVGPWDYPLNVLGLSLSPDDKTLLLPRDGGPMHVLDLSTGRLTKTSFGVSPMWTSFSPDGARLALLDPQGRWGVLAADSIGAAHPRWLVPLRRFNGPNDFQGVGWTADGSQLFTPGPGTVDLWDAKTLARLGTLDVGVADQTPYASAMPDGHTVMIAHPAGDVVTWDLRPQHLIDVACELAGRNLTRAEWRSLVGARRYRKTCPDVG